MLLSAQKCWLSRGNKIVSFISKCCLSFGFFVFFAFIEQIFLTNFPLKWGRNSPKVCIMNHCSVDKAYLFYVESNKHWSLLIFSTEIHTSDFKHLLQVSFISYVVSRVLRESGSISMDFVSLGLCFQHIPIFDSYIFWVKCLFPLYYII